MSPVVESMLAAPVCRGPVDIGTGQKIFFTGIMGLPDRID
jgi:hypothetical protein